MPDLLTPHAADEALYEVIDGRIVEKIVGSFEVNVAADLVRILLSFEIVSQLGRVVPEALFLLDPARPLKRRPNLAFVSYDRWPRRRRVPMREAWEVVPDLAVEIVSQSNTAPEMLGKVRDYFAAGVRLVWIIYPVEQVIYVYRSQTDVTVLLTDGELDGGGVLPGFRVPVSSLFDYDAEPDAST
jgi:Uma2 family endonuclease